MASSVKTRARQTIQRMNSPLDFELVAKVAYELWERRGRTHGDDQADWLEAERIVRSGRAGNSFRASVRRS